MSHENYIRLVLPCTCLMITGCGILDHFAGEPGMGCIEKSGPSLQFSEKSSLGFSADEIIGKWNDENIEMSFTWSEGVGLEQGLVDQFFSTSLFAASTSLKPYVIEYENDPGTYDPRCDDKVLSIPVRIEFSNEGEQLSISPMSASILIRDDSLIGNVYINGSAEVTPDEEVADDSVDISYTISFRFLELEEDTHDRVVIRRGKYKEWAVGTWALQ